MEGGFFKDVILKGGAGRSVMRVIFHEGCYCTKSCGGGPGRLQSVQISF